MKFGRNLTASEILDQALHFRRVEAVDHAVFMGMGEPMMNLDAVLDACRRLPDLGITHRRTTISTVGWVPGIDRLAQTDMPVRLAFSLHAPTTRCARRSCPSTTATRCATCSRPAGAGTLPSAGRCSSSTSCSPASTTVTSRPSRSPRLLDPKAFKVNLIPFNPSGSRYDGSGPDAIGAFRAALEEHGVRVTVRLTRGRDIAAACGQLAAAAPAA